MNINSIHRRQYNQYQAEKGIVLPLIQKESSKENPAKDDEVQFTDDKIKQTLKFLDKNLQRMSIDSSSKQLDRLYPLTPLQSKQIETKCNSQNIFHQQANKKKSQILKVEKTEPIKKVYSIQESKSLNNINQIGLSIQQKKITQQFKRLEKYSSQTLIIPSQSIVLTEQAANSNVNLNLGNEGQGQQIYNQFNSVSNTNSNSSSNNNNYYQSCINQSSQNPSSQFNNYENFGIKKETNRSQSQNEGYNNLVNTYISCFNGKNFTQFIKKYDKDLQTVYDCFMNINFQIPYHITSESKRRVRNLLDRYKNINKKSNNAAFRYERNVQFKQKQFKMFDQFQYLSDKDKFNLLRMSNFPPLKLFPTLSMLKYEVDDTSILFDSKFESGNLRRVYKQLNQNNQQNSSDQSGSTQNNQNNIQANSSQVGGSTNSCNTNTNNNNTNNQTQNKKRNYRNSINMPAVYYSTLSFTYTYKYDDDIVYFAHSVPYTYSTLTHYLSKLNQHQQQNKFYKVESLTTTIIGNKVFCVSISDKINEPISQNLDKKEVIICSRVHPGETNASWIMKGMLDFLLSDHEIAVELRKKYIFRMIPMLNPDGVRYGNYRCCLFGNDLNRKWKRALDYIHSPIHSVKKLIQKLQERDIQESSNDLKTTKQSENEGQNKKSQGKVELLCDIHGHSKFMGAFIYGCQYRLEDEATKANQKELNNIIRVLPYLYSQRKQYFSYEKCCFAIQKDKLGTARVVGFQELKIPKSYTLECSFLGFKNPQITNQQEDGQSNLLEMNVQDFEEVGREFLITLYMNQNQEITNQIIDLFNFKDQQIQNSQVLLEDLQKKLSEFKLSEMKPPQFLKTGFNYKLNEKLNINNITNHIKKEHQNLENKQVISEENQAKNQASSGTSTFQNTVTLPYITPIQRKVSREHAYERNQEEETILENLTKRLRYQLKSQKSQEYNFQSIKFQEPDSIQLNNKNQNFESNSNNHSEYNLLNKKNINQEFQKNPVLNFTSEGIKNSNICQQFGKLQKSNQNKPQKFSFKDYNLEKIQMSVI